MKQKLKAGTLAIGLLMLTAVDAQAQTTTSAANASGQAATSFAGASFGSPIAFGADWGSAGIGVFGQTLSKSVTGTRGDGSLGVAFGLGDADRYVGLETQVSIADLSSYNGNHFGDGGALGFKLHTNLGYDSAFAVGIVGAGRWGTEKDSNKASVYAVATKAFRVGGTKPYALVLNLGIGDQSFQELDRATGFGKSGAGVFGSMAFYITPQISVIADYTGRFLNAGLSVAPFKSLPFTATLGGINLTNRYNTNAQVGLTLGYGFHF
jgi:hypothetical protein